MKNSETEHRAIASHKREDAPVDTSPENGNKIARIKILSGKQFSSQLRVAGKRCKLKQYSINRYPSKDLGVGDRFYKIGYTAPWYITKGTARNWFYQKWVNFYTEDYLMVINYRVIGIEVSVLRNLRVFRPWQENI